MNLIPSDNVDLERLEQIFLEAIDLPTGDRAPFIERECDGQPELRRRVQALLRSDTQAEKSALWRGSALDAEARGVVQDETELRVGQRLGPYRILSRLGAGGMGVVYEAVRDDKEYEKKVAIKLVQRSLASPQALERLRAERQILANLEHPFIARLLDGGTSPEGVPFLVMEYVEGVSVDQFCAGKTVRERLALFRQICAAVAYAHRNLVVHRDLKPGNIRVTEDGSPRLLDFGIAQLLDSQNAPESGFTPGYASPEQMKGLAVSTASDIYSLGVLLRHLLGPAIDQDLGSVVAKAMRAVPEERYSSVDALSEDLARYLDGRTVLAREQRILYRSRKFLRRHRLGVTAAFLLVAVSAFSAIAIWRSAAIAQRERALAEHGIEDLQSFASAGEFETGGSLAYSVGSTTVRALINTRALTYLEKLAHDSPGHPTIMRDLATAHQRLALVQGALLSADMGDRKSARVHMETALRLREDLFAANPADPAIRTAFVETLSYLGRMSISDGDPSEAYALHRRAWHEAEPLVALGPDSDEPYNIAGRALYLLGIDLGGTGSSPSLGDPQTALSAHEQTLQMFNRWTSAHPPRKSDQAQLVLIEQILAIDLLQLRRFADAKTHIQHALALLPQHRPSLSSTGDLRTWCTARTVYGLVLVESGNPAAAVPVMHEALGLGAVLAQVDPGNVRGQLDVAVEEGLLGRALALTGNVAEGLKRLDRAISDQERLLLRDSGLGELRGSLTKQYLSAGDLLLGTRDRRGALRRFAQAEALARETLTAHASDANARADLLAAEQQLSRLAAEAPKRE